MKQRTHAQGQQLRAEIRRGLLAGRAMKELAPSLGIGAIYLGTLAKQIGLSRQWITAGEAAQLKAERAAQLCRRDQEMGRYVSGCKNAHLKETGATHA